MSKSFLKTQSIILLLAICCSPRQSIGDREKLSMECEDFKRVTFEEISKEPFDFQKKKIRIEGYFHYIFEDVAIYEHRNSNDRISAIWVRFDKKLNFNDDKYQSLTDGKIDVIGVFDADHRGHLNQYLGELHILCVVDPR